MIEWLISGLVLLGSALMLLAAIGALRLPDLPTRMHATTKSGALGTSVVMIGVAFYFADAPITFRAMAIIGFIMLTAPVAAHVIGRAAYFVGVPLWDRTVKDILKESYDPKTHYLRSGFEDIDKQQEERQKQDTDKQ
ncbi:monovalent cation/H(+) antiporter subunit G [Salinispirillum sp. LH 10-3-1]|uniref:Monovalent cation/H(+) antiporter subunit G n=1 Tax=Salinispirillum sp. LH 10-3-1 TaxID=2952525 RepID=A0AB38YDA6_9GAMM